MHAYEEHGPDCVRELNGIFAFALWDRARGRLVAARDHVRRQAAVLVDRRPPAGAWPPRSARCSPAGLVAAEVDRVALDHFLACRFVPAPRTLFAGVQKLPAGVAAGRRARAARRGSTSFREAPGEPLRDAGDDELAERAGRALRAPPSSAR